MASIFFLAVFAALLFWAAACDVRTMEIPNRISVIAVALYPIAAIACGVHWQSILVHLGVGFGALVLFWTLFSFGLFGGGDAKLMAAAAVWTGWSYLPQFILWTCLAGGVLSAIAIYARRNLAPESRRPEFVNRFLTEQGLPYAVAIAASGFIATVSLELLPSA
jgi:prepilin peptidase CpaA